MAENPHLVEKQDRDETRTVTRNGTTYEQKSDPVGTLRARKSVSGKSPIWTST